MRRISPTQKFILVSQTAEEVVFPVDVGLEPGQRFHLGIDGSLSDALYLLTVKPNVVDVEGDFPHIDGFTGRWAGHEVAVIGSLSAVDFYRYASAKYENVSHLVRDGFTQLFGIEFEQSVVGEQNVWKRVGLDAL